MTISFILNGEDVLIRCEANARLIDILRVNFGLLGAKAGCLIGKCGCCAVLLNGQVIHACLIPAFRLHGSEIITIEGFFQTEEYQDIISGFSQAGLMNCDYCGTSKALNAANLLDKNQRPSPQEILEAFKGIKCRCTDPQQLLEGVEKAAKTRHKRLYGRAV